MPTSRHTKRDENVIASKKRGNPKDEIPRSAWNDRGGYFKVELFVARLWFKKAESDFKMILNNLKSEAPPTDAICFHSQQAIEKVVNDIKNRHCQDAEIFVKGD